MFLRVPGADLEVSLLLASRVPVAVGVAEGAGQVLAGGVVVSEVVGSVRHVIMGLRIVSPDAHCLGVCLRESSVVFSARH